MNQLRKYKLLAIEAIQFNECSYIKLDNLWQALYQTFNLAQNHKVNVQLLNRIPLKPQFKWLLFSRAEFIDPIKNCSSSSTPSSNCISQYYLKALVTNNKCITNFINIANVCINLGFQPLHFKNLILIIIPKPNKPAYDSLKIFCLIVLLNILRKLIEKVISKRIQT